jgi:hypothetical protein
MISDDYTAGTMDMDINWTDFLQNKVNSFVKWDLVRFFHDNPHAADTAEHIARYIGRETGVITRELNDLIEAHILEKETISGVTIYQLSRDEAMRDLIAKFVEACHDRDFRVKAIHHVIRGMQVPPPHNS